MRRVLEFIFVNVAGFVLAVVLVTASIVGGFVLKVLVKLGILKFP